jgi:hypothetical protein
VADLDGSYSQPEAPLHTGSQFFFAPRISRDGVYDPRTNFATGQSFCTCEAGTATIHTVSVTPAANQLVVTFSDTVELSGPALEVANWFVTINTGSAKTVTITDIDFSGDTVTLTTTPQTLNADYRLHLPTLGITSDVFGIFTGLYSLDFLGVPTPVTVQMVKAVDTHHIDVIFAIAVDEETASDPLNYSIDNGLSVTAANKITDHWYRLTNSPRQTDGVNYTITITNIDPA